MRISSVLYFIRLRKMDTDMTYQILLIWCTHDRLPLPGCLQAYLQAASSCCCYYCYWLWHSSNRAHYRRSLDETKASGDLVCHHALTGIALCPQNLLGRWSNRSHYLHGPALGPGWGRCRWAREGKATRRQQTHESCRDKWSPGQPGWSCRWWESGFRSEASDQTWWLSWCEATPTPLRGEKKGAVAFVAGTSKKPPRITESERRGNQRGWRKKKKHQNKTEKRPRWGRPTAAFSRCKESCSSLCLHPPLLLVTTDWNTRLSWERLACPPLHHLLLLFNLSLFLLCRLGNLECKRAPCWKSQLSSCQLSTASLWLDCLCTAVSALGGCRPRWLTAALGTAILGHVSRWCMRKKKREKRGGWGSGRGPERTHAMLMMQQRTHLSLKHQQRALTWNRGPLLDNAITELAAAGQQNSTKSEQQG